MIKKRAAVGVNGNDNGSPKSTAADTRLARLVESWPDLPEAIRAGITAMVGASGCLAGEGAHLSKELQQVGEHAAQLPEGTMRAPWVP